MKGQEFSWFIGEVREVNDPEGLNRVKVLPFSYYNKDVGNEYLPWSTVMMPNTLASFQGTGGNHQLVIGSYVVGFFRDAPACQDAVVMGSIATQTKGVSDIPEGANVDNKIYTTEAGHTLHVNNEDGSESIDIKHSSGSYIRLESDGSISINGNTNITGTLHATGDISTDAGNKPTLATHKHTEIPGTGGASSPSVPKVYTSVPDVEII